MKPLHLAIASTTSKPGAVTDNVRQIAEFAALIHGLPNLDRQRPMYAHAVVDLDDRLLP